MPNIHKWIIPKNIEKPVEIVYELKDKEKDFIKSPCRTSENSVYQIPSFEEFMKTYEGDEKTSDSYTDELASYSDIRVEKSYGPGNSMSEEEKKETLKKTTGVVGGIGIAALSIVCPPAGAAAIVSTAICAGTAKTVS